MSAASPVPDKVRWGVLGTGSIAGTVAGAIRSSRNGRLEAVASRDVSKATAFAHDRGAVIPFGSYAGLIDSGAIDCLYVALPNSLHEEWTLRALAAGLPVLCEKPLAVDAAGAARMAAAAIRAGLPLAEAFMYRYHPLYRKLSELLRSGTIGDVRSIDARFTFLLDDPSSVSASAELGGGSLLDVGCYCIDLARLLFAAEPERVVALQRRDRVDRGMAGALLFPGGGLATFECGLDSAERQSAEIAGTTGGLLLDSPWFPGLEAGRIVVRRFGQADEPVATPGGDGYRVEVEEFGDAVLGLSRLRWQPDYAVRGMAVLDALRLSAASGRAVEPAPPAIGI